MAKSRLAEYLFERIKAAGAEYTFGIPGDFVLPHYAAQAQVGLKTVVMTHEPAVGFAADAYARLKGLGVALVTYGVGGLNMINSVGLAYAEESPVLVISGAPETRFRSQKAELHHCVKSFDTQHLVYQQVTDVTALLGDPRTAQHEIDRVLDTVLRKSTPGYIEMSRDLVNFEFEPTMIAPSALSSPSPSLSEAVREIVDRLKSATHPVLFVGAQIRRFNLYEKVVALAEVLDIPVVTSIAGKGSFPEGHPNFIGCYFGQFANPATRKYVESADCILCLGAVLTEMETGGYTAKLEPDILIHATAKDLTIGRHSFQGIELGALVQGLLQESSTLTLHWQLPVIEPEELVAGGTQVTVAGMINDLNSVLTDSHMVICDVGDCLYAGLSLRIDTFLAPGYYSSMGYGMPAAVGAGLAMPNKRPIVLVGDGGFQMTGMEFSTAVKVGLKPIVIVFNNGSYAMLEFIDRPRDYYKLAKWDYPAIAKALGGDGMRVTTQADFKQALAAAANSDVPYLIDAMIAPDDISPTLRRLTDHFGKKVRAVTG